MSYLPVRRPAAMSGGFVSDIADMISDIGVVANGGAMPVVGLEAACNATADAKSADMFANQQRIQQNWNPTGFYAPSELTLVVQSGLSVLRSAGGVLDQALAENQLPSARDALMAARSALFTQEGKALVFTDALMAASGAGIEQIEASGLKRWVIGVMEVAKAAVYTVTFVACTRPWFIDALGTFFALVGAVANAIIAVAGLIYDAAKTTIKVADNLETIIKVALWGGSALGGWWLWKTYGHKLTGKKNPARRRRHRR